MAISSMVANIVLVCEVDGDRALLRSVGPIKIASSNMMQSLAPGSFPPSLFMSNIGVQMAKAPGSGRLAETLVKFA